MTINGTDSEMLARYRRGDTAALEVLVEKYKRPLFAFILNMTERRGDADEVFQEVWFRAIRKIGYFKKGNFLGWLIRIARNLIIDRARRRKPSLSLDLEPEGGHPIVETIAGDEPDPSSRSEAREIAVRVAEAVEQLPVEQKEVFLMRTQSSLPFKEIAVIQRVSINTALARMQYALARLRSLLAEDYARL